MQLRPYRIVTECVGVLHLRNTYPWLELAFFEKYLWEVFMICWKQEAQLWRNCLTQAEMLKPVGTQDTAIVFQLNWLAVKARCFKMCQICLQVECRYSDGPTEPLTRRHELLLNPFRQCGVDRTTAEVMFLLISTICFDWPSLVKVRVVILQNYTTPKARKKRYKYWRVKFQRSMLGVLMMIYG